MLSVFLACDDPYQTADFMVGTLGWRLNFATPRDSDDKLASVSLGDAAVMLGTAEERFLARQSREHRGAGVTIYISLPASEEIGAVHARHEAGGVVTGALSDRRWGESAFDAEIAGYRFLIGQERPGRDGEPAPA
jgi:catechol 2,3-dioxygenase-like lactoylglutathione lyase family enzyme